MGRRTISLAVVVGLLFGGVYRLDRSSAAVDPPCGPMWTAAWHASPSLYSARLDGPLRMEPQPDDAGVPSLRGRTVRMMVIPHASGSAVRLDLSNRYGTRPLHLGMVTIAHQASGASLVSGTLRPVTFAGRTNAVIPSGASRRSDPVTLGATSGEPLAVSVFVQSADKAVTRHVDTRRTSYVSDVSSAYDPSATPFTTLTQSTFYLTGVDVLASTRVNALVAVGDSISDGTGTTLDGEKRWTDRLQDRLDAASPARRMAVVNGAISGNTLLTDQPYFHGASALSRLDWDVSPITGVTDIVLHEGTNDMASQAPTRSAGAIIDGMQQFAEKAHRLGMRAFVTTIAPTTFPGHGTPRAVAIRAAVNRWVRAKGADVFEGVFDFAAAVADPRHPASLLPAYDSGDRLHLGDAGQERLANAVDITALSGSRCSPMTNW